MARLRTPTKTWLSLACALTLLAACKAPLPTSHTTTDRSASANAFGNVQINLNGRSYRLTTADKKPLDELGIQAGGQLYTTHNGQFNLPASAMTRAKNDMRGFFVVLAQGYSPKQVWIGQAGDDIVLSPVVPQTVVPSFPASGGTLATDDNSVAVKIPAGMLKNDKTNLALSSYQPTISQDDKDTFLKQRNSFLDGLKKPAGTAKYRVSQAETCNPADGLPCSLNDALGVLVTVDGPLNPGTMTIALDLNSLLHGWDGKAAPPPWSHAGGLASMHVLDDNDGDGWEDGPRYTSPVGFNPDVAFNAAGVPGWDLGEQEEARAASQVLASYDALDAAYPGVGRGQLRQQYGLDLQGSVLSFPVTIDASQVADGYVTTEVQGLDMLGVKLEVTIVSSLAQALPLPASLPDLIALDPSHVLDAGGNLISNNGSALIANNAGNIVANNAGNLVSNNGGGFVANNGGSLSGDIRVPFTAEAAKMHLLSFQEFDWPNAARVRAVDQLGNPLSDWVDTDKSGHYQLDNVPGVGKIVFLECEAQQYKLRTLAPQPKNDGASTADINTATTCVTSLVRNQIDNGTYSVRDVDAKKGFDNTTSALHNLLTPDQAQSAVTMALPQVADLTAQVLQTNQIPSTVLSQPKLNGVLLTFDEVPDTDAARQGLAIATGVNPGDVVKGNTVTLKRGYSFSGGLISLQARGYGGASGWTPDKVCTTPITATNTQEASGTATPAPSPTPYCKLVTPQGPVRLTYTVSIQHGGGENVDYKFQLYVSRFSLLNLAGQPLPVSANLLKLPAVGGLLGNFWTYQGTN